MPINRTRLIATVSLTILWCIFGGIDIAKKGSEDNLPIRTLLIQIEVNRQQELFDQLQEFAARHDFRLLIRDVKVIPKGIFIEMYRDDLKILAGSAASDPTMIDFGIYNRDPANATSEEIVDELFKELKSLLSEIPNVTITEEK